jgi:hypothetical protein
MAKAGFKQPPEWFVYYLPPIKEIAMKANFNKGSFAIAVFSPH